VLKLGSEAHMAYCEEPEDYYLVHLLCKRLKKKQPLRRLVGRKTPPAAEALGSLPLKRLDILDIARSPSTSTDSSS
jgi:hypothetical protein